MSLSMLSMLTGGGPLPIPAIPCAYCVAEQLAAGELAEPCDDQAATIVAGTLVCRLHVGEALGALDRGHVAAQVRDGLGAVAEELARVVDQLDRLERRA